MIKTKIIPNHLFQLPLQKILDINDIAEKEHKHSISDVNGLQTILNAINSGEIINLKGGYIA